MTDLVDYMRAVDEERCNVEPWTVAKRCADAADEIERLRAALLHTLASLEAAISLLERGGKAAKKAAASDTMFDIMLKDYRTQADEARAALKEDGK